MIITGLNYSETMAAMNAVGEGAVFSWWPRIGPDPCFDCAHCYQLCHRACKVKSDVSMRDVWLCSESCKRDFDRWHAPKPEQQALSFI